jgi:hypothetical protein
VIVVNANTVNHEFAMMIVLDTALIANGTMMHPGQFEHTTFLTVLEFQGIRTTT